MTRTEILEKANSIILGDREIDYGSPENNFGAIATLWNSYLSRRKGTEITPVDVSVMMILVKIARIAAGNGKNDNWIDIAGYAACGGELDGK